MFKPGQPKIESTELASVNRHDPRHERLNNGNLRVNNTLLFTASYPQTYNAIIDPVVIGELPPVPLPGKLYSNWNGLQSTLNQTRARRPRAWEPGGKVK